MASRPGLLITAVIPLLLAGCGWSGGGAAVDLEPADREAAEGSLYPQWAIIQDFQPAFPDPLGERIRDRLGRLSGVMEKNPALEFMITREPDADAGCIAGGRVFLSQGALTWIEHADELDGLLALAMTACGQASGIWRQRGRSGLASLEPDLWLAHRYRDFRLDTNAGLYNQLVATGCGGDNCRARATGWLDEAGLPTAGLDRLMERIGGNWPDAAVLERFAADWNASGERPDPDREFVGLVAAFRDQREGLEAARQVWRAWIGDRLREAYQAQIATRRVGEADPWMVQMNQIRLDLSNFHPDYAQRDMRALIAEFGEHPDASYWWGQINNQLRRRAEALTVFEDSLAILPRASTHFYIGRLLEIWQRGDEAAGHFRKVVQAGEIHPYHGHAAVRLAALEGD